MVAHDFTSKIAWLEAQWTGPSGLLAQIREGRIDWARAREFADTVLAWEREIPLDEPLPARFVALLWSVPTYVENHRAMLEASGVESKRLSEFSGEVFHAVSSVLGFP